MAWFRVGLSRRSVVSLRGFSASVGCSIRIPLVSDIPTIIFGADVTRPENGEDSSPSIAAVEFLYQIPFLNLLFKFIKIWLLIDVGLPAGVAEVSIKDLQLLTNNYRKGELYKCFDFCAGSCRHNSESMLLPADCHLLLPSLRRILSIIRATFESNPLSYTTLTST
uniref:Uncharacterized protein n=1 Tax=Salix viminalis TaxID=40686 RepID=A0A6N2LVJ6_SALVM